jgi:hypothetical protein
MQLSDEHLALLRSDIAILREQLDQAAQQPTPDRARLFLRRELLSDQQVYHALIKNRRRQLRTTTVRA